MGLGCCLAFILWILGLLQPVWSVFVFCFSFFVVCREVDRHRAEHGGPGTRALWSSGCGIGIGSGWNWKGICSLIFVRYFLLLKSTGYRGLALPGLVLTSFCFFVYYVHTAYGPPWPSTLWSAHGVTKCTPL